MEGSEELKALIKRLEKVSTGAFLPQLTRSLANETTVRIKDCFTKSQTPYGESWATVERGGQPLLDTGRLKNAFVDASSPGVIRINNPTVYAKLMNCGGRVAAKTAKALAFKVAGKMRFAKSVTIKARQFIPDESRGLPKDWAKRLEGITSQLVKRSIYGH
jgi:phage gpG-like protein